MFLKLDHGPGYRFAKGAAFKLIDVDLRVAGSWSILPTARSGVCTAGAKKTV